MPKPVFDWSNLRPDKVWFPGFLLLLVLLPLPFGSNRPWASDLFGALTALLLFFFLLSKGLSSFLKGDLPRLRLASSVVCISLALAWTFLQTASWLPESWAHPIWAEAQTSLGEIKKLISVDPSLFPEALVRTMAEIGCFILAFFAGRDSARAQTLLKTIAFAGVGYAIYGLLAHSAGGNTILWYKKWAYEGFLTSTFVNKNSYAAYAGLGLLCCIGLVREKIKDIKITDKVLAKQNKWAALFASLSTRHLLIFLPLVLLMAALALTGSRAGAASSLLGAVVLIISLAINKRWQLERWVILLAAGALLFTLFVGLGGDALTSRMGDKKVSDDAGLRLAGYHLTQQAIQDNPLFGFGLGTFDNAFKIYRDSSLPLWFHHAHNDYLELFMDLGIPAGALFLAGILLLVSCCIQGVWSRKRDAIYPAIGLAASVLIGAHVMVDFSLHIPAIAGTYAALLGVGVAQSWSSRTAQTEASLEPKKSSPIESSSGNRPKKRARS